MSEHPILTLVREKVRDVTQPFSFIAELEAHRGRGDALAAAIASAQIIRLTREEPGCMEYALLRDAQAPDRFVAYETWCNLEALREHLATPHFNAVGAALADLLAAPPTVRVLTALTP
jgi:quinol monooxygenase YgiN